MLPAGTRVGHYSIIEKLGEGGEAVVYRARDLSLERDIALKTPRCELASPEECARLLREARAASRLSHPCIVPIHEVFEESGKPWFAMGLVEGATLRNVLVHRGALPAEDVARYGEMLADALRAAHAKHVLHRDVTPGNIFITPDGRLLLADFGLAHVAAEPDATTTAISGRHMVGTIGYMSPEQMMGRDIGPQSDVFSAGVVLFEMATGTRPFPGRSLGEVLDATLNRPLAFSSSSSHIPADLEHITRKALAKRLDERYGSAEDMFIDLRALRRRLESDDSSPALPAPRRRLALPVAVAVCALVAIAAFAVWAWLGLRPEGLPQAVPLQVTTGSGWEAEARISPGGSDIVYAAEGQDGNVDVWLVDAKGGSPIRLTDDPGPDRCPTWYPDGTAVAFTCERGGSAAVCKVARLGGAVTMVVGQAESPAISPDGRSIAFTRRGPDGRQRIFVAPLADPGNARVLTTDRDGLWDHRSPAWSPDGRSICYAGQRDLWVVGLADSPATRLTRDEESDSWPAWSPVSGFVYFSSFREGTNAIWRVPAAGGTPARVTLGAGPEVQPSLSSDGTRLVYSTFATNANVVIRNRATGVEHEIGGERSEVSPALAPDGSALAFSSDRLGGRYDLWLQRLAPEGRPNGDPVRLTDHAGAVTHPSFSPDGEWIAYQRAVDGQRDIYAVPAAGGVPVRFTDDPAADTLPEWSPAGGEIAFVSGRNGGDQVWVAPGTAGVQAGPARQLTSGPLSHEAPSWSPDAKRIAAIGIDPRAGEDVWLIEADGTKPPAQLTRGERAQRVVWIGPTTMLVSGYWNVGRLALMVIDATTGAVTDARLPGLFGIHGQRGEFTVTKDGRLIAAVRQAARGDVWMLQTERGPY